ncbi:hypothetical protein [Methylopila sp. Yamaguchi]|uniref:hypothetical protein n=1 Tax=Methylopila sp. Yamaguchi TaxID=1437817 RepID=UPI000CA68DCA|nr:hypothetical protein [Methylopila sp. Yamaguchi]GBD50838.1 hypothetical protein METY_4051 [Methylopila sp. Yamaguchi]
MSTVIRIVCRAALGLAVVAGCAGAAGAAETLRSSKAVAAKLAAGGVTSRVGRNCPEVIVRKEADAYAAEPAQLSLLSAARDCANLGAETILRVALVGRAKVNGSAADAVTAPIAVTVVDPSGKTAAVRAARIQAPLKPSEKVSHFSYLVDEVSLPPAKRYAGWKVLIGFGEPGATSRAAQASAAPRLQTAAAR